MSRGASVILVGGLAFGIFAVLCGAWGSARATSDPQQFDVKAYQAANAKALEYCTALWSDHAFDPLRDRLPLLGEPPTASMLASPLRIRPEDKSLADLALKTVEKCKAALAPALAMLPPHTKAKVLGVFRHVDALNSQLYTGKIAFGEYNVKRIKLLKQMALAFASMFEGPEFAASTVETAQSGTQVPEPQRWPRKSAQDAKWSFCLTAGTLCAANQERP